MVFWEENQDFATCGSDRDKFTLWRQNCEQEELYISILHCQVPFSAGNSGVWGSSEWLKCRNWCEIIPCLLLGPFGTGTVLICSWTLSSLMSKNGIIDCIQTKRDFGAGRGCSWYLPRLSSGIQIPGELKCGFSWKGSFWWRPCAAIVKSKKERGSFSFSSLSRSLAMKYSENRVWNGAVRGLVMCFLHGKSGLS